MQIQYKDIVKEFREKAEHTKKFDKNFKKQLQELIVRYPQKSRILTIYGDTHRIQEYLPKTLQMITRTSELYLGSSQTEFASFFHDIQDTEMTDDEILQRIESNPDAFLSY